MFLVVVFAETGNIDLMGSTRVTSTYLSLPAVGPLFGGEPGFEAPRRAVRIRLHGSLHLLAEAVAAEPGPTAMLRLRDAGRDRLALGDLRERHARGAASFPTTTTPRARRLDDGRASA